MSSPIPTNEIERLNRLKSYDILDTDEESMDAISRNVEHLELMKTRDYWTDEDMTAVDAAIVSGNAYNA